MFRSVLNNRPRMLTVALHEKMWAAYDTQDSVLHEVFPGGVKFVGSVYDTTHGPQPKSVGPAYYKSAKDAAWTVVRDGKPLKSTLRYRGYQVKGTESVTLQFELQLADEAATVRVDETPSYEAVDGKPTLRRTFAISGLPEGVTLQVPLRRISTTSAGTQEANDAAAGEKASTKASESPLTQSTDGAARIVSQAVADGKDEEQILRLTGNGTATLITTWESR